MESHIIEGNNVVEVFGKVSELAESMRQDPRPVLLEFKTFRMRGHEEASGTKYVPNELMERWAKWDPIENFREYLRAEQVLTEEEEVEIKTAFAQEINDDLKRVFEEEEIVSDLTYELNDVYKDFELQIIEPDSKTSKIRFVDAVSDGLQQAMRRNPDLVIMGQDIAEYGGVFKITEGFVQEFGKERVRNTPISESGVIEAAYGLSVNGMKAVVELQFGDFITSGFNPVINLLAKSHYRWGQNADVVLRMPCGAGVGAGPFHSQTNEAWFTKTPGLKVVYPAFPVDAKGLLCTAVEDPNPVLFFEHKQLYRSVYQEVPDEYYTVPFGKAALIREGDDLTVVSYGAGVHWALEVLERNPVQADLIDLRSLQPLDEEAIYSSVRKTGKLIILQEDTLFGGIASDISALVTENCFEYLDAPIKRVGAALMPIPFAKNLENLYLPRQRFEQALIELLDF
jgi:2-oxoisovalerate dehydrogenase E1 component